MGFLERERNMFKQLINGRIPVLFLLLFFAFLLSSIKSAFAAEMTFNLLQGLNGISLPFENTGITDAEQLCQSISNCDSVSYWDASTQKFISYKSGAIENNFPVIAGYPYFVIATQGTSWTVAGDIPESITFNLIATGGTDMNVIALPINMTFIKTTEDLANTVPNVDTVWYWDALRQGYVGHPKGTEINNFNVFPGYPYFVNITADTIWTINVALKGSIVANPRTGDVPLEVQFLAVAKGGTPPYSYSWDVNADGTVDDTRESFSYTYQQPAIYVVTLRINDASGNSVSVMTTVTAGQPGNAGNDSTPRTMGSTVPIQNTGGANQTDVAGTSDSNQGNSPKIAGPGWFMGKGQRVSHKEAKAYFDAKQKKSATAAKTAPGAITILSATSSSPEINELARALRYDPKLIYDYVHNHIDYAPYFGSLKGATLTYLDGSGNDLDQASLMISLLRTSGYTAQYVYGQMTIPGDQMANWLGTDQVWQVVSSVIASGGIPLAAIYTDATATLDRVWVKATINSVDYLFDPAFKSYSYTTKIDLGTALAYNQSDFLTAALTGATVGSDYIQNTNETNLRTKLASYSANLANTIRTQYPNKAVEEIIGGRSIIQTNLTQYSMCTP